MPRIAFHASNGEACAPMADCHAQIGSMSSALPATTPSRASLWPARPLVAAWSTRSTPWSSGRCTVGPAKVESTTVMGPLIAPIASRSTSDRAGLAGVSTKTTCVLPGRMAAVMASASVPSTKVTSMPKRGRCITISP